MPCRFGSYVLFGLRITHAHTSPALLRLPLNASFGLRRSAMNSVVTILVFGYYIAIWMFRMLAVHLARQMQSQKCWIALSRPHLKGVRIGNNNC
jgi:hypothetical protein